MKTLRIILTLLLVGLSQQSIASIAEYQPTLKAHRGIIVVRTDSNLQQGSRHGSHIKFPSAAAEKAADNFIDQILGNDS